MVEKQICKIDLNKVDSGAKDPEPEAWAIKELPMKVQMGQKEVAQRSSPRACICFLLSFARLGMQIFLKAGFQMLGVNGQRQNRF